MSKVFLSHKQQFGAQADRLNAALRLAAPGVTVFQSEDIDKGRDWRAAIDNELDLSECFVLLYASPELDWSWCFYEAGRFSRNGHSPRPVFCVHPELVELPSPLANLQGIGGTRENVRQWLEGDFFRGVRTHRPTKPDLNRAVAAIEKLVSGMPSQEKFLKPYIWIVPKSPGDWRDADSIDFSDAIVEVEKTSALSLGFSDPPNLQLLPFLRRIACDAAPQSGKVEFWIEKLFESLRSAVAGHATFQEEAYFRHESGEILRPVVVSYARCGKVKKDPVCKLRVIFAEAFGSPLTEAPGVAQRLSIGARLAVRTQLEVIDPFIGRVSRTQQEKQRSTRVEDEIGRKYRIGGRLVEALRVIVREAESHGVRVGTDPPKLFENPDQHHYEKIAARGWKVWRELEVAAKQGDEDGDYTEAERALAELKQVNEDYLALVLPRIEQLFVPVTKRRHAGTQSFPSIEPHLD
jgi:hypothetical protein